MLVRRWASARRGFIESNPTSAINGCGLSLSENKKNVTNPSPFCAHETNQILTTVFHFPVTIPHVYYVELK